MIVVVDGNILVDGMTVGSIEEYNNAPRRYELAQEVLSMSNYMVKMDGMKVRMFHNCNYNDVEDWANEHCHEGEVEIISLVDCGRLPSASSRIYPNESMPDLVYKPFVAVG